ncbi:hypothetical protein ACIOEX_33475, partial [Streptomyces sp. NPDC087850]|uniref:hypothetical protein n=1 Tax=Streptomyces sp. NPDC087850 TaxID=3365809 RepID=UPI00380ECA97
MSVRMRVCPFEGKRGVPVRAPASHRVHLPVAGGADKVAATRLEVVEGSRRTLLAMAFAVPMMLLATSGNTFAL